jgi:hydrogenase maturation protease
MALVIGIGNEWRCDDGVGRYIARLLRCHAGNRARILEQTGEGTALIEAMQGACTVFLVDAVCSGASSGTVYRFEATSAPLPVALSGGSSSHAFGVNEAIEMSRALKRLPEELIVYGVEAGNIDFGHGLSPEVERAAEEVVKRLIGELGT